MGGAQLRFGRGALLVATAVALGAAPSARATVVLEVSLEQMAREADAIVHGRVLRVGVQARATPRGLEPHTVALIQVSDWLKGQGPALITVDELGGTLGDASMRVDGTPVYRPGEEVVLFLRRLGPGAATYRTFALAQGKLVVLPGVRPELSVARQDLAGLSLARRQQRDLQLERAPRAEALQLRALLDFVRARPRGGEAP